MPLLTVGAAVSLSISLSAETPEKRTLEVASIRKNPDLVIEQFGN
jgi:hypothetical protein